MDLFSFFTKKYPTKDIAKSRLKLVIVQDRINCSSQLLETLKTDILNVISNYMEIDEETLDFQIGNTSEVNGDEQTPVLYANIPIKNMRKLGSRL